MLNLCNALIMKRRTLIIIVKSAVFNLMLLLISIIATAQKLPKIQLTSLRAPNNIKIDGKATEWDNKFQAYNSSTGVFYTIANDDDKLYLVIQATDQLVIRKIIVGSITFTVNSSAENKDKKGSVTYPVFNKKNWPNMNLGNKPIVTKDSTISSKQVDSFMYAANQQLTTKSKEIKITGVKDIGDTLSIYNQEGIRAVSLFDHQIAYTYELAVPLKYLGLSINNVAKFSYHIMLNGSDNIEGLVIKHIEGGTAMYWNGPRPSETDVEYMRYPTDFTGNYTLAKK